MHFNTDNPSAFRPEPTTSLNAIVGKNVQHLRVEQDLPKKTFANIASVSRPLLDKIENGEADLRLSYIVRIADSLSVTPIDLLKPYQ